MAVHSLARHDATADSGSIEAEKPLGDGIGLGDYDSAANPDSILDVIPRDMMVKLMQGYFYSEKAGMGLLYDVAGDLQSLKRLDTGGREFPIDDDWSPFCFAFRYKNSEEVLAKQNDLCVDCDMVNAQIAFAENSAPRLRRYVCHMGIHDMTYSLTIGDRARAVLFAGQTIASKPEEKKNTIERIRRNVIEKAEEWQQEPLMKIAEEQFTSIDEFDNRAKSFDVFGAVVQQLVNELYEAKLEAAARTTVASINDRLIRSVGDPKKDTWTAVRDTIENVVGGVSMAVFVQRDSQQFVAKIGTGSFKQFEGKTLSVVSSKACPKDQLEAVNENLAITQALRKEVGLSSKEGFAFRSVIAARPHLAISSLIYLEGDAARDHHHLLELLCRSVTNIASIDRLVESLEVQQEEFHKQVAFWGHSLKTPLQIIEFTLSRLKNIAVDPSQVHQRDKLIAKSRRNIMLAKMDAELLTMRVADAPATAFDIVNLLRTLKDDFSLVARQKSVDIRLRDLPDKPLKVDAPKELIRIAIANLLDNAIKYSYEDKTVHVDCRRNSSTEAIVTISNYGIGFSKKDDEKVFAVGGRANVIDVQADRPGTGLGIPHAAEILDQHGGSLRIESRPADDYYRADRHRYLTTVSVTLPIR